MRIEEMIAAVQDKLGVEVDGKAGPETWGAIYARLVGKRIDGHRPMDALTEVDSRSEKVIATLLPEALPHVQAGKLHALGVMSPQRSPVLPNVPTMAENGVADLTLSAWVGLLAPAKTPRPVVEQLNRAVRTAMDAEFKAKLGESGIEVAPSTPEELQRTISSDIKLHADLIKAAGLTPQ